MNDPQDSFSIDTKSNRQTFLSNESNRRNKQNSMRSSSGVTTPFKRLPLLSKPLYRKNVSLVRRHMRSGHSSMAMDFDRSITVTSAKPGTPPDSPHAESMRANSIENWHTQHWYEGRGKRGYTLSSQQTHIPGLLRTQNDEQKLETYFDLRSAMSSVMYVPPRDEDLIEENYICTWWYLKRWSVLSLLCFVIGVFLLDWFVFWLPQRSESNEHLQSTRLKLINPAIVALVLFARTFRMFDETHKHGIKRLILFLLLPCKIFVSLSGMDRNELVEHFEYSLLSLVLLIIQHVAFGLMMLAIVKSGLVCKKSAWVLWINMTVMATAVTGYPFAQDVSPDCFTNVIFLDLPQKLHALLLSGLFLFYIYAESLSLLAVVLNFATNLNVLAMIAGFVVSLSGLDLSFSDDDSNSAYCILCRALVALANCLGPLGMVFIGLSLSPICLENMAQIGCVFLRRGSWIIVGLYYYFINASDKDEDVRDGLLAIIIFVNSSSSIHVFLHMENVANALDQKAMKDDGDDANSPLLDGVNAGIETIMPLICYDFGVSVIINIIVTMQKDFFTTGINVIGGGIIFVTLGTVILAIGVCIQRRRLTEQRAGSDVFRISIPNPRRSTSQFPHQPEVEMEK